MWSDLDIRQKVFILFAIITLVPLIIINLIWLRSTRKQLEVSAGNRQSIVASSSAHRVSQAIDAKINSVVTHSQETSVTNIDSNEAARVIRNLANQDSDIRRIALVDKLGDEKLVLENHEFSKTLKNVKQADEFRVVTQLSNEVSIGDIQYINNEPILKVSVPLLLQNRLGDQNLTSAEALARRYGADINGALIVNIDLTGLWESILAVDLGNGGYAYIVDAGGRLIGHRDVSSLGTKVDLSSVEEVMKFIKQPDQTAAPAMTISEKDIEVLSTHALIERTGWAIIAQEPKVSIFEPVKQVSNLAFLIFFTAGAGSVLLSLLFSRNITKPIRRLVDGTSQLAQGNFDMQVVTDSNDEIGVLGKRFNTMAADLKQLVSNLKTESTKLNVVLDNVGEGIIATDSENRIVLSNISAAVLAGTLPIELIGKRFEDVFGLIKNNKPFELKLGNSEVYKVYKEVVYIAPSKRLHYLDVFANKIKDDPSGINYIITFRDQTDERELEMMKLDFVSMAAHELRTPITAIRGYIGLLASDEKSKMSKASKQSLERAQSSVGDLVGLINNLLNVTKIERGALTMHFTKVNWTKLVQDVMKDHEFTAKEKGIRLQYVGSKTEIPLVADEIAIKEVVNNLINNAINYTDSDGVVTIGVSTTSDQVVTYVQDTGYGIPANAMHRLFTKFYRVKGGIASGSGGTGLGLYISKSIVELHKGTIQVESEYGKGSTFTITLPAYDEVQYKTLQTVQHKGVNKRRGWVTKNTTG